jgi:DNA-binding winged helix-turn-helix (wHTH) protein
MRIHFGECEFDSRRRVLLRHGRIASLSPKAFQLLEVLLDRRPEAVAKSELLAHLWPETFVADGSLHNVVAELRAALGDPPRAMRYVRTIPRYGYAFCGDARDAHPVEASHLPPGVARVVVGPRDCALSKGPNIVGRDRACAVRIDSPTVSRRHARIVLSSDRAMVEDLESKNGTFVNGRRVGPPLELSDGDEIRCGAVTMTFRTEEELPSTESRRP